MQDSDKKYSRLDFIVWCIMFAAIAASLTVLWLVSRATSMDANPGVVAVRLMYQFDSPRELADNQAELMRMLTEDEFSRLTVDEELRAVNTYFKFGYASSRVEVVSYRQGYVLYCLHNENIDPETYWVFLYDVDKDGLLCNIQEYQLVEPGYTEGFFDS